MSNTGTTTTSEMRPATTQELQRMLQTLKEFQGPVDTQWLLVAPDGRVWRAEPKDLLQVLVPYHPLLSMANRVSIGG